MPPEAVPGYGPPNAAGGPLCGGYPRTVPVPVQMQQSVAHVPQMQMPHMCAAHAYAPAMPEQVMVPPQPVAWSQPPPGAYSQHEAAASYMGVPQPGGQPGYMPAGAADPYMVARPPM